MANAISQLISWFKSLPSSGGHERIPARQVLLVLAISGLCGFCVGLFGKATWQVVVQTSQVLAGVVEYPIENPQYAGQLALWTILHQICAIFLRLGGSEKTLSLLCSGLLGMVSFQALALCVLALSRNAILAVLASVFIYFTDATDFGVAYPIWLLGQGHTYGIVGRSFLLLVIGMLGCGYYRPGGFLLGLAPAVHPSLGAFLWLVVALSTIWDYARLKNVLRIFLRYIIVGGSLTLISLGIHLILTRHIPSIAPEMSAKYLDAFIQLWDTHRRPVAFRSVGVYLVLASLLICFVWRTFFKQDVPQSALFLLRIFMVSALLSIGFAGLSSLSSAIIPRKILMLMPARYLNVNIVGAMAILIGMLGRYRDRMRIQAVFSILVALLVGVRTLQFGLQIIPRATVLEAMNNFLRAIWSGQTHRELAWMGMLVVTLMLLAWKGILKNRGTVNIARGILLCSLSVAFVVVGVETYVYWKYKTHTAWEWLTNDLRDRTNDPLFAEVHARPGMLLTCADMYLIQLRARRPILLEGGALDYLPYVPSVGPEMERILRDVYGIDFFHPPEEALHKGTIPVQYTRTIWEDRTPQQWGEIRKQHGVRDVLTYADWDLRLPQIIHDDVFILYAIPEM